MRSDLYRGIEVLIEDYKKKDREIDRHLCFLVENGVIGVILREYIEATDKRVSAMREALARIGLLLLEDE